MSELAGPARPPRAALPLDILARLRERGLDDPAFDAVLSLAVRVGGAGLTMVGQILAARVMGIAEFGAFANAWVWAMLVAVLAQVGFATTTTRFGCAYRANGTAAELRGLLVFSQGLVLATGLLAAGTVVAVAALAGPHLSQGQREALMMGALCVPILAQIDVGKGLARVSGSAAMAYLPGMLARPAVFLGGLFVLVQTGVALDGARALAIMLAASLAAWAFQALLVRARLSPLLKERGVSWHRRDWLAASRGVVVSDAYLLFVASIDVILLNLLASAEAGGRYFAAAKLAALLSYVLFAISAVAQGRLAMLVAEGREADLRRQARTFCAWAFWPTAAAAGALALAGPFLLQLFGPDFAQAAGVLAVLATAYVVQAAAGPVRVLLVMARHQDALAALLIAVAAACVALNLALIPPFGAMGAAFAFLATSLLATAGMLGLCRRRLGFWCLFV